jgi:four helix bundle protein
MTAIKRFEDLNSWKKTRELAVRFYRLSEKGSLSKDFALRDQMRRSIVSVMSNLAEGFERNGNKEFLNFCYIAKASAGEFRSQLYLAADVNYLSPEEFDELSKSILEISAMIAGLIRHLQSSELKGVKFAEAPVGYGDQEIISEETVEII